MSPPNKLLYSTHLRNIINQPSFRPVKINQRNFSLVESAMCSSRNFTIFSLLENVQNGTLDILDSDTGFLLLPILLGNIHHIF